jgi:hypothetical protein
MFELPTTDITSGFLLVWNFENVFEIVFTRMVTQIEAKRQHEKNEEKSQ